MNLIPVNMLKSPKRLRNQLQQEHELLITNNGKPMAVLLEIHEDEDPEITLKAYRKARSALALSKIRKVAKERQVSNIPLRQINKIISTVRQER